MKLGIKVGPEPQSITNLEETHAPYCEVWFNVNKASEYAGLFDFLTKQHIDVGLHFWGALPNGAWTNFAYPDTELIKSSLELMRKTIDIAAQNHFQYVNIHPGTRTKVNIDFAHWELTPMTGPVDLHIAEELFLEHAHGLHTYATDRGVVFTVETVPPFQIKGLDNVNARLTPTRVYDLPIETLVKAGNQGLWIANDICHTAANKISNNRTEIAKFVHNTTKQLFSQTRLVHVGFVVPPYNGTDFHDHLDNPLLDSDKAVPNKNELKQLLKLFENRDDVWAIVEPVNDHVKNYFLLKDLVQH